MNQHDSFEGSPWNAEPNEEWNQTPFWNDFYQGLLADAEPWQRKMVIYREMDFLIRMLTDADELPRSSPQTLLDAGCGIAVIPHVLSLWGFQVTAIDSCPRAMEVALDQQPDEEELAQCVPIWEPRGNGTYALVENAALSLQRLRDLSAPGGSVAHITGDWFDECLPLGSFGIVHCRNSLRCSTKPYWRRSLLRFRELLKPGGILLLENVNAIGIQFEVEELIAECGFVPLASSTTREPPDKYVNAMWPTG
jgi:SAM-dependent methyltransferase